MSNLKQQIIECPDLPEELVPVPEWGGISVLMVGMTAEQRGTYASGSLDEEGERRPDWYRYATPRMVAPCLRDPETREVIFDVESTEDLDALNTKSGAVLERLSKIAGRLSGMGTDEESKKEEAKVTEQFHTRD